MIPLRDVVPARTTPGVTISLIVLNAAVFASGAIFDRPPTPPPSGPDDHSQWLPVIAGMFMHAGSMALVGNLVALWLFGENVEDRLGHRRFLALYLVCGIMSGSVHAWTASEWAGPGAAGAVAGIIATHVLLFPRSRVLVLLWPGQLTEVPAIVLLGIWLLLVLAGGQASWGLTFSFLGGGALGRLTARRERAHLDWYERR